LQRTAVPEETHDRSRDNLIFNGEPTIALHDCDKFDLAGRGNRSAQKPTTMRIPTSTHRALVKVTTSVTGPSSRLFESVSCWRKLLGPDKLSGAIRDPLRNHPFCVFAPSNDAVCNVGLLTGALFCDSESDSLVVRYPTTVLGMVGQANPSPRR
jgi:hypothetical protein